MTLRNLFNVSFHGQTREEVKKHLLSNGESSRKNLPKRIQKRKFELKKNNINTLLRTGYDPELYQMAREYEPLDFDENKKSKILLVARSTLTV